MKTDREKIAVMEAFCNGQAVEFKRDSATQWIKVESPAWDWSSYEYRIKKAPELRAWKFFEIPVGCAIRIKNSPDIKGVILRSGNNYVTSSIGNQQFNVDYLVKDYEHSIDFGKTWHPCGVME